jgi:hypothetical protein
MTRQLTKPIEHLTLAPTNRMAIDLFHQVERRRIRLDPPYQRGRVWTDGQRLDLMYSLLSGYPVGTLILNNRAGGSWGDFTVDYAVIDGKQRLETVCDWFRGDLPIPASWVPAGWITAESLTAGLVDFGDGDYITEADLTPAAELHFETAMSLPVVTARLGDLAAEAEVYRLVNTGGTAHTAADLARAALAEKE